MAVADLIIGEKYASRSSSSGEDSTAEITYIVIAPREDEPDLNVKRKVLLEAPSSYIDVSGPLTRQGISQCRDVGGGVWEVTVTYADKTPGGAESSGGRFTFRTTGGAARITTSRETMRSVGGLKADGSSRWVPTDHHGTIGVTEDGGVEGTEIVTPVYEFSETHAVSPDRVSYAYRRLVMSITGKVSTGKFKGLNEGETLFLGVEGEQQGESGPWDLTYYFAGSENQTVEVPAVGPVQKDGWEECRSLKPHLLARSSLRRICPRGSVILR